MYVKLWTIAPIVISVLVLTGCQTADFSNPATQTIDIPVVEVSLDSDGDSVSDELDICCGTPLNEVVDDRGCHMTIDIGIGLKMEYRAFFAEGSSEILPKYQAELNTIAERMEEHKTATMRIEGHASTDEIDETSVSSSQLNSLSRNRALIVKNYLIMQHQIDPNRLITFSFGAEQPIAPNDISEGRAMNRRVYGLVTKPNEDAYNHYEKYSDSTDCIEL